MLCPPGQHYWLADTANGPKTRMVCKYCPAVQYLDSYLTEKQLNRIVLKMSRLKQELVVAANDASALEKAQADYVCDGTADEVQIESAITALSGKGKVKLTKGIFTLAAPIDMPQSGTYDGITLEGDAKGGTQLYYPLTDGTYAINVIGGGTNATNCHWHTLRDFKIVGVAGNSGGGIKVSYARDCLFENVRISTFPAGVGIYLDISVMDCTFIHVSADFDGGEGSALLHGLQIEGATVNFNHFIGCIFHNATGNALHLSNGSDNDFYGCEVKTTGTDAVLIDGSSVRNCFYSLFVDAGTTNIDTSFNKFFGCHLAVVTVDAEAYENEFFGCKHLGMVSSSNAATYVSPHTRILEAEEGRSSTTGAITADATASGGKMVRLNAEDEYVTFRFSVSTDYGYIQRGRYLITAYIKDSAQVANDVRLYVRNTTDAATLEDTYFTATSSYMPYSIAAIVDSDDDLDVIQLQVLKETATANNVDVDFVVFRYLGSEWERDGVQSALHAKRTAVQSIPSSTVTKVVWTAEEFDLLNEHDTSTGVFTATQSGIYMATAVVAIDDLDDGEQMSVYIYKEGASIATQSSYSGGAAQIVTVGVTVVVRLAVTDTLDARVWQGNAAAQNARESPNSFFMVSKIE